MIEQDKSAGHPGRPSVSFPMSSSMPNPFTVPQGLVPVPNLSQQPRAPPQVNPQASWAAGKNLNRISETSHNEKEASKITVKEQQLYLNLVHHFHQLEQQQRLAELKWIYTIQQPGMDPQAWGEQAVRVSPTPSLEYHSSNLNSGSSPPNMQIMDHSTPAGYPFDTNSPGSMPADSDSPASNDDVSLSSMFLGPHMTAPTGYEGNELQSYTRIKAEREDDLRCFNPVRNLPTPSHSFEHQPSPSTSPPESFVHWNHTSQASEPNVGFLAPPQNPMAVAQGLHGFPPMPVLTAPYAPRGMPSAVPSFTPSMEQGSTLGVAMNVSRSGSLGGMESLYTDSFSDNYDLSSSGQHFLLQTRHGGSAVQAGCQPQLQQHHQACPTIVYPGGHSNSNANNMGSLESHAVLTNMGFGTNAPTWTHPSPSMATSTESLPRVTVPSLAQQHDSFSLPADSGSTHCLSQASHSVRGQAASRVKETKGSAQIPESKARKPLPSSRSLAPKKDKRGRQSSRSPSPAARPASRASPSTQGRRPRKQAKRREANREPSPPPAAFQGLPVLKSRTNLNPTAKARALALDEMPTYYLQQHANTITTPQPHLPPLVPSSPIPAWSLFPLDNPKIGDHVYKYHYPVGGAKATTGGSSRTKHHANNNDDENIRLVERRKKDEYIFHWKKQGYTYNQIKAAGGFTEAESTLRGRYRMITKEPEERVRKPKWTAIDVKLLERAVRLQASVPGTSGASSRKRTGGGVLPSTNGTCAQHGAQSNGFLSEEVFSSPSAKSSSSSAGGYYPQDEGDGYHAMPTDFGTGTTTTTTNADSGSGYVPYLGFESRPPPTRADFLAMHNLAKPVHQADLSRPNVKIPWKAVAEEIKQMGGTYQFGPATCRKRWDALVHEHVVKKGKDINEEFYAWLWGDEVFEYFEDQEKGEGDDDGGEGEEGEEDGEGEYDFDDDEGDEDDDDE